MRGTLSFLIPALVVAGIILVLVQIQAQTEAAAANVVNLLPIGFAFALVASGALWTFADGGAAFVGQTLTIAIATPYLLLGLAVVHQISRPWPWRRFALFVFYLLLLLLLGLPGLALVAGLGLTDQLIGLRQRFAGAAPDEENE